MKKTLILQCPGVVCSPPVVSKCLGEAHRRLGIIYITLDYIKSFFFFHTVGNYPAAVGESQRNAYSLFLGFNRVHGKRGIDSWCSGGRL